MSQASLPTSIPQTRPQQVRAIFANQLAWLQCALPGPIRRLDDTPAGNELVIVTASTIVVAPRTPRALDRALSGLARPGAPTALVWSASVDPDADLLLHARGLRESFRPNWMWLDLETSRRMSKGAPGIRLREPVPDDAGLLRRAVRVPYLPESRIERILEHATLPTSERRVRMLIAEVRRRGHRPVVTGAGILMLDEPGPERMAGMYNIGVDPAWRGRGIGGGIVNALAEIARAEGAVAVGLNATPDGERVYRRLGFTRISEGQTWFAPAEILARPPRQHIVTAAEHLGRGALDSLDPSITRLDTMPNGESPLAFAVRFGQRDAVDWLLRHGTAPDVMALWALGMRHEAMTAMADPDLRNRRSGPDRATPLHEAVRRNDPALVEALLGAGADLKARDTTWTSRPLEWAEAMGRPHLATMIREAMRQTR